MNNWLHSIFSQVDVYLYDTVMMHSLNTYPCHAGNVLRYGAEPNKTQLTSQLWCKVSTEHMEGTTADCGNIVLVER